MSRSPVSAALVLVTLLAACAEGGIPGGTGGDDTCNARAHRDLIGQTASDPAALTALAPKVRLIYPGTAVTQDHQPDRMNVMIDERTLITGLSCG